MNKNFDNKFSDTIVSIFGTLVRTAERVIVVFWDGLRNATVHGTPSLVGFVAALAPVLAPIPMATTTALSLMAYLNWVTYQAVIMAIVIEAVGFPLWVFSTETILKDGWKGTAMQFLLGGAVVVYQAVLILINVALAVNNGAQSATAWILFLVTMFPALCAIAFGYSNSQNKSVVEQERMEALALEERERKERKELEERIRQERRQDAIARAELKMKYASETGQEQLKERPFRGKSSGKS
jgi:small-conductance mechanosensitive channel